MKVLKQLLEQRQAAVDELKALDDAIKTDDGEREFTADEERRSLELLSTVDELDDQIKDEKKAEKRKASLNEARELVRRSEPDKTEVSVESEPMQYGLHSDGEHSFFADLIRYSTGALMGGVDSGAAQRMATWAHQVEREVAHDTERGREALVQLRGMRGIRNVSPIESRNLVNEVRDRGRASLESKEAEFRSGITTGGGATASSSGGGGAAFVIPVFYEDQYAPYRQAGRAFADAVNQRPLPPYGMTVYLPAVQAAAGIGTQTEGSGITETDPTFGFISGGLITTAGEVTVTQQLLDRAGPNVQFDQILFDQLRRAYAPQWDKYVLTQALANAGAVTFTAGSWAFVAQPGTACFVSKAAGAINNIETTNGTIMSPTHIFVQPSRWNFIESVGALESSSGTLHPLLVPTANGPFNAFVSGNQSGFVDYEGDTGYKLFGLPIYKDLNIPTPAAGADQAVVLNSQEVYAYEGPLVPRVVPQTLAPNLAVLLQLYSYGTALVRYPSAVQAVSGTGMAAITF